ncbi:MAG TPA: CBS domain-containing protein [Deltaproteobacteria bacterium]|nr:CBS domain-containing protein [Deltaproteobacteria bacterium]
MAVIEDLMATKLVIVSPKQTVREAAAQMDQNGVGAVLVVGEESGSPRLMGLFSERDLLHRVVVEGLDPGATSVLAVMTKDPVTVEPDTPIRHCAEVIREKGFRHLPVVREGRPVGILSTRDFQEYVVRGLESFIDEARYREALAEGQDPYDHFGGSYGR